MWWRCKAVLQDGAARLPCGVALQVERKERSMAVNNILVAVDDSDGAKRAIELAASIVEPNPNAHIDLVNVVAIPLLDKSQMANFKEILDIMMEGGKNLLQNAIDDMGEAGERADALLLTGVNPANELIKLIKERDYDLVVIGNRGLSGVQEYLGSVSHKVLHGSPVSVLIAK